MNVVRLHRGRTCALAMVAVVAVLATGCFRTVAGTGRQNFNGDNRQATGANLDFPMNVATDHAGNLYISERGGAGLIRRVDMATHVITTYAGSGALAGYNGDGMPATSANLDQPKGLAMDASDNLFIADIGQHRVRRVDAVTKTISTIAGTGATGYNGDGQLATAANLDEPTAVAVDGAGNVYIADDAGHRVRRVDAVTGLISTVAGTGLSGFNGDDRLATTANLNLPGGVASDAAGNLYISDYDGSRVRRVDAVTGMITAVAGLGVSGYNGDDQDAVDASLYQPVGVFLDANGNLYIADSINNRVRRVDAVTHQITTVAGNGTPGFNGDRQPATDANLTWPLGVTVDGAGNLFIADTFNNRVRMVEASDLS